jgi:signal transduction histidine kinase
MAEGRHPVSREFRQILWIVLSALLLVAAGFSAQLAWRERDESRLHDFHRQALVMSASMNAAISRAHVVAGQDLRIGVLIEDQGAFLDNQILQYNRTIALGSQLLELHDRYGDREFVASRRRLAVALDELRARRQRAAGDDRAFAIAFATADLRVDVVIQQLQRMHEQSYQALAARIAARTRMSWLAVLAVLLLASAFAVWRTRRGLRLIDRILRHEHETLVALDASRSELSRLAGELELRVQARTAELAEANKELEAFAQSVSHDLRAPLRAIDGLSRLLAKSHGAALEGEGLRLLERICAAAARMDELTSDLLELSRVGRKALRHEEVDVSALAREVAADVAPALSEPATALEIAPGMRAKADPALLRIALSNLIGNACKYSRRVAAPRIELHARGQGSGYTEFVIRDNGAGFDMAHSDLLFRPFQRLHAPHEFEGSGIGLSIVERIVSRHGGTIRGEARVGEGATFYFTLPSAIGEPP